MKQALNSWLDIQLPRIHKAAAGASKNSANACVSVAVLHFCALQMMDEAGLEHLADVLGPDHTGELMSDMIKLGAQRLLNT